MTLSRIARVVAPVSVARRYASATGDRWPPTSVEWMLDVMSTIDPVGIEGGHEPHNDVVQDRAGGRARVGREAIRQRDGRQMAPHFRRVDARRDEYDRLAVLDRVPSGLRGAQGAGIGQAGIELPVIVQAPEVLRARNRERDEWRPERGLAELFDVDPITGSRERVEITNQHGPFDQLAIVSGIEAEDGPRRRDDGSGRGLSRRRWWYGSLRAVTGRALRGQRTG